MTSKRLFFKRMKQDFEQRVWLPVVFFIFGFLVCELPLISSLNGWSNRADYIYRAQKYLLSDFFTPNSFFTAVSIAFAIISALSGFAYIHSAKKLDVYHSLPVKRQTLFFQQYLYGVLYYVIPMIVHVLICIMICVTHGVCSATILGNAVGHLLVQILIYLVTYALAVIAVCLTGNMIISVLGSTVLLVYSLGLYVLIGGVISYFFETCYGNNTELIIPAVTPLHMLYNMLVDMMSNRTSEYLVYTDYWGHYGKLLLAVVIYTLIALFLYRKRPVEAAGNTMAFSITEPVVKAMVVIPASIISGIFFNSVFGGSDSFAWFVVGALFGFLIACPLMEVIFRKDVKAVFQHPWQMVFNGACVIGIILVLQFDLLGYDSYFPKEDEVESYAIDFASIPTIYSTDGEFNYDFRLNNMQITGNASTRSLLEHAIEITRPLRRGELEQQIEEEDWQVSSLDVKYNLKNGKTIYRSYAINLQDEQVIKWLGDTYNDMEHKLSVYPVLTDGREEKYIGVFVESTFAEHRVFLSEEKMRKLAETYRRELTNFKFDEMLTEYPVAEMTFLLRPSYENGDYPATAEETWAYASNHNFDYFEEYGYEIYPSFTQTIALLKEYQAEIMNVIPVENVVRIDIEDYSGEVYDTDGMYDKIAKVEYTQEAGEFMEMEQILPNLVASAYVRGFRAEEGVENYIDVRITYIVDDMEYTRYCNFRENQIPEFVKQDLESAYQEVQEAAQ